MTRTAWWTPIFLLAGCTDKGGDDTGGPDPACASTVISGVTVAPTAVGPVMRASWTASESVDARVQFGPLGECDKFETSTVSGTSGEILLIGLPASTEGCLQVVAGEECAAGADFTTGPPPQGIAVPSVTIEEGGDAPFIIMSLIQPPAQVAIDRSGGVVWANVLTDDRQTTDIHLNDARDGFHFNDYAKDHGIDDSYARHVTYDGVITESIRTPTGHHAYELFDDGRIVYLGIDVRDADYLLEVRVPDTDSAEFVFEARNGPVVGDVLIEVAADGTTREIWNAWDDLDRLPIVEDLADALTFYPQGIDWTHANYFEYDAARDSYLISFRNLNSLIEVSAADGTWMRSVGEFGEYTVDGYALADWEPWIGHPHNARILENGNVVFMSMPDHGDLESRVLELAFDDAAKTATIVWDYGAGLGIDAQIEGAGDRLPNGNTLVNWGAGGLIQEVTADQTVIWEASFDVGSFAGHAHVVDSFYPAE